MIGPLLDATRPVFLSDPVARSHPLNRGRIAWWLALPGLDGGRLWYDLLGRYPGTLTAMGNSSNGWRGTSRPGGSGHVLFDGTAGYVDLGATRFGSPTAGTLAAWINFPSNPNNNRVLSLGDPSSGSGLDFYVNDAFGSGSNRAYILNGPNVVQSDVAHVMAVGAWHRVVWAGDGSAWSVWIDGQATTLSAIGGSNAGTWLGGVSITGTPKTLIGARYNFGGFGNFFAAAIDDVSLWSRPLSSAEVAADYELSRRGYPGVLNRYRSRVAVLMGATAGATYSGSGSPALGNLTATATASFTAPVYSGSGSPALASLTATASASFTAPVYSGSGTPALGSLSATATASFAPPVYSGSGAPALAALSATASASYAAPVYFGSGSPSLGGLSASGSGTVTAPVYSGAGTPALGNLTATAAATYAGPVYAGSGTPALAPLTAAASASFAVPVYSGTGSPALGSLTATASVIYAAPGSFAGSGTPALSPLTATGAGSFAVPVYSGSGTPALASLIVTATAGYAAPVYSGSGTPSLAGLTASGSGTATTVPPAPARPAPAWLALLGGLPATLTPVAPMPATIAPGLLLLLSRGPAAPAPASATLLEAIVRLLRASPALTALVPTAYADDPVLAWADTIAFGQSFPAAGFPRIVVAGDGEVLPGETADDQMADFWLSIFDTSPEAVKAIGRALVAALDSGPDRAPLVWTDGVETFNVRNPAEVGVAAGLGASVGSYMYHISYRFYFEGTP